MLNVFMFLIGFGLSIVGFMYMIIYLNYLTIGYSISDYFHIIFTNFECLLAFIGLIIIAIVIIKGD